MRIWFRASLLLLLLAPACSPAARDEGPTLATRSALTVTETQKLTEVTPAQGGRFGHFVAVSGNTALITAPHDGGMGAAHVFTVAGGVATLEATLTPSDGWVGDAFGEAAALDGDTAAVMARADNLPGQNGAVYVFVRSGGAWTQQAKLLVPRVSAGDIAQLAVALDGDTILASSVNEAGGVLSGEAQVFTRSGGTWSSPVKLLPVTATPGFARSVTVSGNTALLGSPDASLLAPGDGVVHRFLRGEGGNWTEDVHFGFFGANAHMGRTVALDGDIMAFGGDGVWRLYNPKGDDATLKVFEGDSWPALRGNVVLAGTAAGESGHARLYHGVVDVSWSAVRTYLPSDPQSYDQFGRRLALGDGFALVGAEEHTEGMMTRAGAAYLYVVPKQEGEACAVDADCLSTTCMSGTCGLFVYNSGEGGGGGAGAGPNTGGFGGVGSGEGGFGGVGAGPNTGGFGGLGAGGGGVAGDGAAGGGVAGGGGGAGARRACTPQATSAVPAPRPAQSAAAGSHEIPPATAAAAA
ncbi:hypothetical protein [Polyangium sp. 15x6]|uniref:hypothetical protein n=1 Tax=Polyangium sp. 15x6 TaxID=3042687 RepID=UPI00249B647B|nr:hypothetical protein [Polyangium sp. 15x6]MDI3285111.1 hypothetical protein [Polyangium sp. 15x6]